MKLQVLLATSAAIALSACSSGPSVTYAQPGDEIAGGSTFATQDVKRFVVVNGTTGLKDQTISYSISSDGQTVYVSQNYKDYTLVADGSGVYRDGNAILFRAITLSDVVEVIFFSDTVGTGYYNGGYVVGGYQTVPAQVAAQVGSATYNGATELTFRTSTLDAFGTGSVALTANFGSQTVTGTMNIVDSPSSGSDFVLPDTTITINPGNTANISGNQFITNLGIAVSTAGGDVTTIAQTGLNGKFYGVDAASVGASYWATGMFNGEQLFIEGALASE